MSGNPIGIYINWILRFSNRKISLYIILWGLFAHPVSYPPKLFFSVLAFLLKSILMTSLVRSQAALWLNLKLPSDWLLSCSLIASQVFVWSWTRFLKNLYFSLRNIIAARAGFLIIFSFCMCKLFNPEDFGPLWPKAVWWAKSHRSI